MERILTSPLFAAGKVYHDEDFLDRTFLWRDLERFGEITRVCERKRESTQFVYMSEEEIESESEEKGDLNGVRRRRRVGKKATDTCV